MKKFITIIFIIALLISTTMFAFATSNVLMLDTRDFNGDIDSVFVQLSYENGDMELIEIQPNGKSGKYMLRPKEFGFNAVVEYFIINDIMCYPGFQVNIAKENKGILVYNLDTLKETYLVTIDKQYYTGGNIEILSTTRYFEDEIIHITASAPDGFNLRRVWVRGGLEGTIWRYDYDTVAIEKGNLLLEPFSGKDWTLHVNGINSDLMIRVYYE